MFAESQRVKVAVQSIVTLVLSSQIPSDMRWNSEPSGSGKDRVRKSDRRLQFDRLEE